MTQELTTRKVTLTPADVKNYICPEASVQEIALFLKICESENLNPFAKEIYLVKYGTDPARILISVDTYEKAAENSPQFNGMEAGIILAGEPPEYREGTFITSAEREKLLGGWAKVYRKDRDKPFYAAVTYDEYEQTKRDGTPNRFWREMPATMIRNVAKRHALKEAFPNKLGPLDIAAEFPEVSTPPSLHAEVLATPADRMKIVNAAQSLGIEAALVISHIKTLYGKNSTGELTQEEAKAVLRATEAGKLTAPADLW